jgi:hypothetical protein
MGDPLFPMLEGDAPSRGEAKRACMEALLQQMRALFQGTGDLLQGELPDHLNNDDSDELDWESSVEPSVTEEQEGDKGDSWFYDMRHDAFCLTLELPFPKGTRPISLERGEWRWWFNDEVETIREGSAASRSAARQQCVGALLDHLTKICVIAEDLRGLDLPTAEFTDRERPYVYAHDEERLDPNWVPEKPEHPTVVEILRNTEAGASADSVLATVHKFGAELSTKDLREALEIHRAKCFTVDCPVLAAMEAFLAARERSS